MLSRPPDDPSGATRLRDRPALQPNYLSTRDRGAGQQGLPLKIEDPVVLRKIAILFGYLDEDGNPVEGVR